MSSPPPAARLHNNTVLASRSAMTELAEESVRLVTCSQKLMRLMQFGSELISALLMASPRLCRNKVFFSKRARKSNLSFCSWVFSSSPGFQEGGRPDPGEAAGVRQGELPPTVQTPTPPLPPHSRLLKCHHPSLDAIAGARFYFYVVPPRGYWTLKQLRGAAGRISLNLPTGGRRTFNLIRADKGGKKKAGVVG